MYFKKQLIDKANDDRASNNMGRCFAQRGMRDSAMYYFDRALKINPDNSYIYHNRAALYYDEGNFDLACADLQTAIDKEYTWLIDDKLEKMKNKYCPNVNTNLTVLIHDYKGNVKELSNRSFISLRDSSVETLFTPLTDTTFQVFSTERNTESSSIFNEFKISPNPSNGRFSITSRQVWDEALTLKLFNLSGQVVFTQPIAGKIADFDLSSFSSGTYIVMVVSSSSVLTMQKLIVTK